MYNYNGLTDREVIINRKKYGMNVFTKKKKDSFFKLLMESFTDPIIKILLIALGIKIVFLIRNFDWFETVGIVIAIVIASLISSISEYGSMKAFNTLTSESSKINVRVKRNMNISTIPISDLVVGDLVLLSTGDKIPADGIIISGKLSLDESMMNGESREVFKDIINNKLYMGSVVYSGTASMKVEKVGDKTFYGNMASMLQDDDGDTPLKIRLSKLAQRISKIGYICSLIAGLSYLFYMIVITNNFNLSLIKETFLNGRLLFGYILNALTLCVTIIVVSVPEGLPMMITLVLSSNMKRMLRDNVLVRKLVGIETAGNINVLFTDKTGTITKGKLSVIGLLDCNGDDIQSKNISSKFRNLIDLSLIANNESIYDNINNKFIGGNLTDRAIMEYIGKKNFDYDIIKREEFSSSKKYMCTKIRYNGHIYNFVKGAYEVVGKMCNSSYLSNGDVYFNKDKNILENRIKSIEKGMNRVIAIAYNSDRETINNLYLLGFIILKDEIRDGVKDGIRLVKNASIQTVMITGDNKDTAISIGKDIGLLNLENDIVLTHDEISSMSDHEISKIFPRLRILARAMPQDKSRLVGIAKNMDFVVGMTGDGVNDALALKKADVGFAMGSGTEVAKEASDIVILDDNFYSITNAILYGRTIFKSIRKFIICQLTINLCSLFVSIIGPFIGVAVPITVVQMLWINMIMDTLSGFAFSYEPALPEYMDEPPKKRSEGIINRYMLNQIVVTGFFSSILCIFFLTSKFLKNIFANDLLTAFFGLIIFISIFNSFSARTHRLNIFANITKNKVFIGVILFVTIMQIVLLYYGGEIFRTNGLTCFEFFIMFLISLMVFPIDFFRKFILKRKGSLLGV